MISNAHRFHGRNSIRFVYQRGQTVRGPLIALRYAHNNRQQTYRVAVVVSRKVSKSAVVRNRIRRRIYEIIRNTAAQISEPYDLVFTVYGEDAATIAHTAVKKVVIEHLQKSGALQTVGSSGAKRATIDSKEENKE